MPVAEQTQVLLIDDQQNTRGAIRYCLNQLGFSQVREADGG